MRVAACLDGRVGRGIADHIHAIRRHLCARSERIPDVKRARRVRTVDGDREAVLIEIDREGRRVVDLQILVGARPLSVL